MRTTIIVAAMLSILSFIPARAAAPPELAQLAFLLGKWTPTDSGRPGAPSGGTEFALSLTDRVIVRENFAEYPATADKPASRHEDIMIIYAAAGDTVLHADYYDSESHVIRYSVTTPEPDRAIFLSEPGAPGPRFRLTYVLDPSGTLKGAFEIAPPGSAGGFRSYLSWESRKSEATTR